MKALVAGPIDIVAGAPCRALDGEVGSGVCSGNNKVKSVTDNSVETVKARMLAVDHRRRITTKLSR